MYTMGMLIKFAVWVTNSSLWTCRHDKSLADVVETLRKTTSLDSEAVSANDPEYTKQ